MACPSDDRILDYVERRLSSGDRDEIEAHVDGCRACRQLIAEMARTTAVETPSGKKDEHPDGAPKRIGRYRIERQLGQGGMGAVYVAYDPQLDRRVALKLVHPELASAGGLERLLREGRALAKLDHPNIVGVHDAGTDEDRVYIAMELVDGQNVAAWLAEKRRTWREILAVFLAAARGLAAAHAAGIVHRDVKPENILIDREGHVKVADFGLALDAPPVASDAPVDPESRLTHPGAVVGTPAFMSPEQWTAGATVGPATDQFSLCAALRVVIDDTPRPRWIDEVIHRGVHDKPEQRYPSMATLAEALDPARRTRRTKLLAAAIAVPLVAGGITVFALTREGPAPDPFEQQCAVAAEQRALLWTEPDREAVKAALAATGVPWHADIYARADKNMRSFLERLAGAEAALCGSRPQTAEARSAAEVGLECFATRRREALTFTAKLRGSQARAIKTGELFRYGLASPEECANITLLEAERRTIADPTTKSLRLKIKNTMAAARTSAAGGKLVEAMKYAQAAVDVARPMKNGLTIDALIVLGEVSYTSPAVSEAAFRDAAALSETLRADEARARALAYLVQTVARINGREREAIALEPLVSAALERGDRSHDLAPMVHQALGVANLRLNHYDTAVKELQKSLDLVRASTYSRDPRLIAYFPPLAEALEFVKRRTEALALMNESVQIATDVFGPDDVATGRQRGFRAGRHVGLFDCEAALADVAAARAALGALPPYAAENVHVARAAAACHRVAKDYATALRELQEVDAAFVAAGRKVSVERGALLGDMADTQRLAGDTPSALALYAQAAEVYEGLGGTNDPRAKGMRAKATALATAKPSK